MALDKFQPYLFVSAGEQSNKYLTPVISPEGIASFQAQRAQDLTGLTVRIDPIQDLHGQANPYPAGGGENLFYHMGDLSATVNGVTCTFNSDAQTITISGTNTGTAEFIALTIPITVDLPRETALCRAFIGAPSDVYINLVYKKNGVWVGVRNGEAIPTEIDAGAPINVQVGIFASATTIPQTVMRVEIEKGSTAPTAWSPYSNICPISGRTGLTVTAAGRNIVEINNLTVTKMADTTAPVSDYMTLAAGTYTLSYTLSATVTAKRNRPLYRTYGGIVSYGNDIKTAGRGSWTFTLTEETNLRFEWWYHTVSSAVTLSDFMLEIGDTAHEYAPYGGAEYPITWESIAGTVYGGTLDVVSGVLTVTDAQIASYAGETLPGEWISDRDVYVAGTTPTTGAQVVYKLATPQTYQLSPTDVKTLAGFNQIYSDSGPVIDIKF